MNAPQSSPQKRPPISRPFLEDPEFVEGLRAMTQGRPCDVLVAIPTNDAILALALAQAPKRVIFLVTEERGLENAQTYESWLHGHLGAPVQVLIDPEPEEGWAPLKAPALVKQLHHHLRRVAPDRVGLLVTSGTSEHTALLTHYANVSGARSFHVVVPYNEMGNGAPDLPFREIRELGVPEDIRDLLRLTEARRLADHRHLKRARELLEGCRTLGDLKAATLAAVEVLDAREGLRLEAAARHVADLVHQLDRQTSATRKEPLWAPLEAFAKAHRTLFPQGPPDDLAREITFAAEALCRGAAELEAGHFDLAALLHYRFAEAAVAFRLRRAHQIDPDAGLPPDRHASLRGELDHAARAVHGAAARLISPGAPLGLVSGLLALHALHDEAWCSGDATASLPAIQRVKALADRRNRNLYAHGFEPSDRDGGTQWRTCVEQLLVPLLAARPHQERWGRIVAAARAGVRLGDDVGS